MTESGNPYPWQREQWRRLTARAEGGNLPHAILLTGAIGMGKGHFARSFARWLLCEGRRTGDGACGTCRSCQLLRAGSHPDLLMIAPEEGKSSISVDQVRELGGFLTLKSHYAPHKVTLLSPAEKMNPNAANALLKSLEEPTPGAVLLLVSHRPGALLPTIRSRCQTLSFSADPEVSREWLAARHPDQDVAGLVRWMRGGPLAMEAALADALPDRRLRLLADLEGLAGGRRDPLEVAREWTETAPWVVDLIHSVAGDLLRHRIAAAAGVENGDWDKQLRELGETVDLAGLNRLFERSLEARRSLTGQANPQMALEELLVAWVQVFVRPASRRER